jgi:hypothetical protein
MCRLVAQKVQAGGALGYRITLYQQQMVPFITDLLVLADARRIVGDPEDSSYTPTNPQEFANRIFHTCYMGTENSSAETRGRAKALAEAIGRFVVT